MSFMNASEVLAGDELAADICIIGGGAAGLTLACELNQQKLSVVLLEAGGMTTDHAVESDTFGYDELGVPLRNPIVDRGRRYGGSTSLWFGRVTPPGAIDLAPRDWVADSGWPISADDLPPWLERAAERLGVAHQDKFSIDEWPHNPAIDALRQSGSSDLGVFLWADKPDVGESSRDELTASPHVRVVLDATVTELVVDDADRVEQVSVRGLEGNAFRVAARYVVLAAGGLENPRLLLASTSRYENGVGNHHDNVGRYYLDHPRAEGLASIDVRGLSEQQLAVVGLLHERAAGPYGTMQLRVVFDDTLQRSEGLLNHALHGHLVSAGEQSRGFRLAKEFRSQLKERRFASAREFAVDAARLAAASPDLVELAVRRATGRNHPTDFVVVDQLEQEPNRQSRVMVDHKRADRFGLPRLQIDWQISDSTVQSHRRLHDVFRSRLAESGITTFDSPLLNDPDFEPDYLDMKHPSGTTRMSASPRTGVVDGDCLVHGVKNLYVVGSSVFPTSGHFNPTLTIVALASRLSNRIARLCG